jgi:hypothetical protein
MQAMLQSMNLDARVQVSEQVQVFDEEFGRSVLRFADAFARGDDDALRESLDPSGREILEMLSADWSSEVESIEAVRLVAASAPVADEGGFEPMESEGPQITGEMLRDQILEAVRQSPQELEAALQNQWSGPGMDEATGRQMANQMFGPELVERMERVNEQILANPGDAERIINELYDDGTLDEIAQKTQEMMESMAGAMNQAFNQARGAMQTMMGGDPDVSLAIQQPGAAFLVNFTVVPTGGRYLYIPTAGNDAVLTRASEWDDMQLGMNLQASLAEGIGDAPELGSAPEAGDPGAPGDDNPLRRNTPRGPVTVPGGS